MNNTYYGRIDETKPKHDLVLESIDETFKLILEKRVNQFNKLLKIKVDNAKENIAESINVVRNENRLIKLDISLIKKQVKAIQKQVDKIQFIVMPKPIEECKEVGIKKTFKGHVI